ncbi:MAG: hypothetical protein AAFR65_13380 [Pseudomonadota bacterium]
MAIREKRCVKTIGFCLILLGLFACGLENEPLSFSEVQPLFEEHEEIFDALLTEYPAPSEGVLRRLYLAQTPEMASEERPYIEGISGITKHQRLELEVGYGGKSGSLTVVLDTRFDAYQIGVVGHYADGSDNGPSIPVECGDEALTLLDEAQKRRGGGSFRCRLSDRWYAYKVWSQ